MKLDVLIMRVCRGQWERCEVGTWLAGCYCLAQTPGGRHLGRLLHGVIDGEPAPAARNSAVVAARQAGVDVLVMVDADMSPAPGFLARAVSFLAVHPGPVAIGSPYCGGPPGRLVQVTRREDFTRFSRDEASARKGDELVGCIGTGLLACRLECFEAVAPPWFDYEWADPLRTQPSATEDFYFTRRLSEAGGRVFCAWQHWSGHAKTEIVGKPE